MNTSTNLKSTIEDLLRCCGKKKYRTILADPPWQFQNRTGKVAPEHKRLNRYSTMTLSEIKQLPITSITAEKSHLYLWVPNALLPEGLEVMAAWGFKYKTNIIWEKVRKDGFPDGRGVGFYFRNATEILLFGVAIIYYLSIIILCGDRSRRCLGPYRIVGKDLCNLLYTKPK